MMDIINRGSNMINPSFYVGCCYNINCRLTLLKNAIWRIGDLECKVLKDWL